MITAASRWPVAPGDADGQGHGPVEPPADVGEQADVGDPGHQQQRGEDRQRERPQDQGEVLAEERAPGR